MRPSEINSKERKPKFTAIGIIILFIFIFFIGLMLFKIYQNKFTNNFPDNNYKLNQNNRKESNFDNDNLRDINGKIDTKKLNNYLKQENASWRAEESDYFKELSKLPPERQQRIINGVNVVPKDLESVDIYGLQITGEDVLNDKFLEYLGIDDNSEVSDFNSQFSNVKKNKISGFSTLNFAMKSEDIRDLESRQGIAGQSCSLDAKADEYNYYPFEIYPNSENAIKYGCVCIPSKQTENNYSYGYEICENGKTKIFSIDEFKAYVKKNTAFDLGYDSENLQVYIYECYPDITKINTLKDQAKQDIFNSKTKKDAAKYQDIFDYPEKYVSCSVNFNYPPKYKTDFQISYINPPEPQGMCGSCVAFATIGALEMYLYHNFKYDVKLSENFLIKQQKNSGCSGAPFESYYNFFLTRTVPLYLLDYNNELILDAKALIDNETFILKKTNILYKNKEFAVPFSINPKNIPNIATPLGVYPTKLDPRELKYYEEDACEFNNPEDLEKISESDLSRFKKNDLNEDYDLICPNDSDESESSNLITDLKGKKIFVDNYFVLDITKECNNDLDKANEIIKKIMIMTKSPLIISINSLESLGYYKSGIWSPIYSDLNLEESNVLSSELVKYGGKHAVVLYGWGTDEKTGDEYWMIRNSWGDSWGERWGEQGNFKVWMNKTYTFDNKTWNGLICSKNRYLNYDSVLFYGFVGEPFTIEESELKSALNKIVFDVYESEDSNKIKSEFKDLNSQITDNSIILSDTIEKNSYLAYQKNQKNATIPDYILKGECITNTGELARTGFDFYKKFDFDKLLFTWEKREINDDSCDFGKKFCDQDQLRIAMSKKVDILNKKEYISLGDLKFKSHCVNGVCMIDSQEVSEKITEKNRIINLTNLDLAKNTSKSYSNINDILLNVFPKGQQKYLIITVHFNTDENFTESKINELISKATGNSFYVFEMNGVKYYQFSAADFVDHQESLIAEINVKNSDIYFKFSSQFSKNMTSYFGNCLNSFLIIPKKFGSLKYQPEIIGTHYIFTKDNNTPQFLSDGEYWKFILTNNSEVENIDGLNIYEINLFADASNYLEKEIEYSVSLIKKLNSDYGEFSGFIENPINARTFNYITRGPESNYSAPEYSPYNYYTPEEQFIYSKVINHYSKENWSDLQEGKVLSVDINDSVSWINSTYYPTTPAIIYFQNTPTSKFDYTINYIDNKGESYKIIDGNENRIDLYLFKEYFINEDFGQILINLNCDKENNGCPKTFIENANYKVENSNSGEIYLFYNYGYSVDEALSTEGDIIKLMDSIGDGKICVSTKEKENGLRTYIFWHNPAYLKYRNHYLNIYPTINPENIDLNYVFLGEYTTPGLEIFSFNEINLADNNLLENLSNNTLFLDMQDFDKSVVIKFTGEFNKNEPVYILAVTDLNNDLKQQIYFEIDNIINNSTSYIDSNKIVISENKIIKQKTLSDSINITIADNSFIVFVQIQSNSKTINYTYLNILDSGKLGSSNNGSYISKKQEYNLCNLNMKLLCTNLICETNGDCLGTYNFNYLDYKNKKILIYNNLIQKEINQSK
jgi:hypothetical protein